MRALAPLLMLCLPVCAFAVDAGEREHIVEFTLKDLGADNARELPSLEQTPRPPDCGLCADRADIVEPITPPRPSTELAARSQLHRLRRDVREQQGDHGRAHQVEDSLERVVEPP